MGKRASRNSPVGYMEDPRDLEFRSAGRRSNRLRNGGIKRRSARTDAQGRYAESQFAQQLDEALEEYESADPGGRAVLPVPSDAPQLGPLCPGQGEQSGDVSGEDQPSGLLGCDT